MFKIRPAEGTALLAIEARDEKILQATYLVINTEKAEKLLWLWQDEKSWWQGLEGIIKNNLLLHGYATDKSGNHAGIFAVDLEKKTKKWQQEALSFRGITGSSILAAYPDQPEAALLTVSPENGDITGQLEPGIENSLPGTEMLLLSEVFTYPFFYSTENPYFGRLAAFVKRFVKEPPVLGFDYLETASGICIGFYFKNENNELQQDLLITDLSGKLLGREVLAAKCNGRGVDNFFIFRNILILIQNRSTLIGFVL